MHPRLLAWLAYLSTLFLAATGCSKSETPLVPIVTETFADDATRHEFVDASNAFAFDLYGRLRERKGNLVVSPVSVSTALGMVLAGARGETEREIKAVLHVSDLSRDEAHRAAADLQNDLNGRGQERDFTLSVANRLWAQKDQTILDGFTALMQTHYGAEIGRVDFINAPDDAVKQVNAWAAAATRDRIPAALDREHVDELTRLVLVNATYFKGEWASPFEEHNSEPLEFFRSSEDKIETQTMFQSGFFAVRQADGYKVLRMHYAGHQLSFVGILPDAVDGLPQLEQSLTVDSLASLRKLKPQQVRVWLPKFKFTGDLRLDDTLALLGMPSAFDAAKADLSGIDNIKPTDHNEVQGLFVQHAIHRAFVELNEEGTEAAATTAFSTNVKSAVTISDDQPFEFRADHPFLFFIQDEKTGAILFMGRVVDPSKE